MRHLSVPVKRGNGGLRACSPEQGDIKLASTLTKEDDGEDQSSDGEDQSSEQHKNMVTNVKAVLK